MQKNNKTEVASLLSYNDSEGNAPADSSYQDSIFKDQTLQEVKAVARKPGTVTWCKIRQPHNKQIAQDDNSNVHLGQFVYMVNWRLYDL